jgi:hypothetical protein
MSNPDLIFLNYLSTVFDGLDDSIMLIDVHDETFTPLLVNDGFYRNSGREKTSIQDLVSEMSTSPTTPDFMKLCYEAIKKRAVVEQTLPAVVPAGNKYFNTKAIPILNSLGTVTHLAVIGRDVTELRQKDEEIKALKTQLKAKK